MSTTAVRKAFLVLYALKMEEIRKGVLLIAISGPPCSGKSSLASELGRHRKITHLELDKLRARLLPQSRHSEEDRDLTYRAMHLTAEHLLTTGQSVILDATYGRPLQRRQLIELARDTGARLRLVQFRISPHEAVRRFHHRTSPHFAVDLTSERVGLLVHEYQYDDSALVLRAEEPLEHSLKMVESYL